MKTDEFRTWGHQLIDWLADYLDHPERYPVLAQVKPGEIAAKLPAAAPEIGETMETIFADFKAELPGVTKLLLAMSRWFAPPTNGWAYIIAFPFVWGFLMKLAKMSDGGRYAVDAAKLKVPILGGIHSKTAIARSEELHNRLWAEAVAVANQDGKSIVAGLFIDSLNETIDMHTTRGFGQATALSAMLFGIALLFPLASAFTDPSATQSFRNRCEYSISLDTIDSGPSESLRVGSVARACETPPSL